MVNVDFHTHTTSSDGILTPTEVVKRAYLNNIGYLAITDHDTVSGLEEAVKTAKELGIHFIPGIELSTTFNGESIHVLGFFRDDSYLDENFIKVLNNAKNHRVIRAEKIINKLKEHFNIEINKSNVFKRGKDVVARPHIAEEIISSGYPYDKEYIFNNFIGKDCPAFVESTKLSTIDGIKLLKEHNALVFLAHPVLIKNSPVTDLLNLGFDGIEAVYFQNSPEDEAKFIKLAKENNLLISAGSDCHGDIEHDLRHGDIGCMSLPKEALDKFLSKYNINK